MNRSVLEREYLEYNVSHSLSNCQVEQDFMFALFLQKQEEEVEHRGGGGRQQRPRDPDVGHFCAPNTPGFCEANFCIFHTKDQ